MRSFFRPPYGPRRVAFATYSFGVIVGWTIGIFSESAEWRGSEAKAKLTEERTEIINQNTEIIKSLGSCAESSTAVSDLLMRVSHYVDKHSSNEKQLLCPECTDDEVNIAEKYFLEQSDEHPTEDVPTTHKQVLQDLREIESSVDSITFGHLNQMKTLENKLSKYREQEKLWLADFFGGIERE